jgi:ABC-type uncharacterized transport system permease subunit
MLRFIIDFIQLLRISILLDRKKAQGLSIQTIIIAVLGIIVLFALIVFFIAKWGGFKTDVNSAIDTTEPLP